MARTIASAALSTGPEPDAAAFDLDRYLNERRRSIEAALSRCVPEPAGAAARLYEAMRYSLLGGGKRIRPILALAACEAVGGQTEAAMGLACAIEMIHTYSLIHDDLPCMDDDDFRRGRPSNHKVYGAAIATLAGDALLTDAFKVVVRRSDSGPPSAVLETIAELAEAAGSAGMVGGQTIDLAAERHTLTAGELEELHGKKTGALFIASIRGGARLGGASPAQLESLEAYARLLGLAFQIVDDLLDVEGSPEAMGKQVHKDETRGKATYPALFGLKRSHEMARELERGAHRALESFGADAEPLRQIATFVVERKL
ncbi:MAG: polyprenyl synthetase family protein [Candidatus Binataceae bacterium]